MKKNFKKILLISSVLLILFTGLAYAQVTKTIEWAFTQDKQQPEKLLIGVIDSAKSTLDIAIYSLTHPDIVDAIKKAKKRGVAVRIITDKTQASGKTQTEALKILGSAGIEIKVNSHSGLMHHKMTIADKKVVTTGSYNYSKAASTTNDEVFLVIRDEEVAKAFSEHFNKMWNDDKRFETVQYKIAQAEKVTTKKEEVNKATTTEAGCSNPKIKGNKNSKIYHVPGGAYYDKTTENVVYFCTEEEAQKAGYRKSQK